MHTIREAPHRFRLIILNCAFILALVLPSVAAFLPLAPRVYLHNVPPVRKPALRTWVDFSHGNYQRRLDAWAYRQSRWWPFLAKAQNTLNYHFFGLASEKYSNETFAGKHGALFDRVYLNDLGGYYRSTPPDPLVFAKKVKNFQRAVEQAGKSFLVVVHPNKAVMNPDWVSSDLTVGRPQTRMIDRLTPALKEAQVNMVTVANEFTDPAVRYWPTSGAHLNNLGKCLSGKAVLEALAALGRKDTPLIQCDYHSSVSVPPQGEDLDLVRLINGWKLGASIQPVPDTKIRRLSSEYSKSETLLSSRPRILVVGTSYIFGLVGTLAEAESFSTIHYLFYNKTLYFMKNRGLPTQSQGRKSFHRYLHSLKFILSHDIIILESTDARIHQLGFGIVEAVHEQLTRKKKPTFLGMAKGKTSAAGNVRKQH